jgi:hypothetical protein|tara:strand:+ start:333 stop:608 length:276 start_codon:yes stop_codon:yes gene_type:complete
MGGYILAILSQIILKQGNIWDTQKVKQKGYLNKNLKEKENKMDKTIARMETLDKDQLETILIKLLEKKNLTTSNQTRYLINQEYSKALGLV